MTEEPLHVQVARALGCTVREDGAGTFFCGCLVRMGQHDDDDGLIQYPVSGWAEILEREKYSVYWEGGCWNATDEIVDYEYEGYYIAEGAIAETPGEAVCKLFVRLKGAK